MTSPEGVVHGRAAWAAKAAGVCWPATPIRPSSPGRSAVRSCGSTLTEDDQSLHSRHDKIDLPPVRGVVTRVERYSGHCPCCGGTTLAPVPVGLEVGTPFSVNILALALYLRLMHAISYQRLTRLFLHLFVLRISEGNVGRHVPARQAVPR